MQHCATTSGEIVFKKRSGREHRHVMVSPAFVRPSNLNPILRGKMEHRFPVVSIGHAAGDTIGACFLQHFALQILEQ